MQELERARRVVIVVAHPDDEVIGAGGLLPHLRDVRIIHTTDGSPLDVTDALRSGFTSREDYAAARQQELAGALQLAGIPRDHGTCLGYTDGEAMYHLEDLRRRLAEEFLRLDPDAVLTHPYEGGHPDHDATAFAVHGCFGESSRLFEMTSYHSRNGVLATGVFLPNGEPPTVRKLREEDVTRKREMLACFKSQESVLRNFPVVAEQFRRAPRYDFTKPPHGGLLHYEGLPWGITGHRWRKLAAKCECRWE